MAASMDRARGVPIAEAARRMGLISAGMSDEEFRVMAQERFKRDWQDKVCQLYDVPPWIVSGDHPTPRFPRLRWMLRRVWPV